ncbi:HAMP domain-containing histidine kinase [Chitinophaga filiformis]|uniref:sensor histidine kinase n=1 Tax=Chitinophaga filiformis TaxID=104663 RepID=UPI001F29C490|nr:HAMP domain-containing sensor histidine kinase [Chitinophaga filiformis]MCF6406321.1 HAMP domain-containing histidine kinase [Chitinophaga filiformis]
MKLYLFSPIEKKYREEFDHHTMLQNIKVAALIALTVAITATTVRVISWFVPYQVMVSSDQFNEYRIINNYTITTSTLFAGLLFFLWKKSAPKQQIRYHFISILYSLSFIGACMALTFIAQHNPKNTMTMLLLGLISVGVLLVYSLRNLLLIAGSTIVTFMLFFHVFQVSADARALNYVVFWLIITCFLFISRLIYSYHANYFIKLKTIEDKNREIEKANQLKNKILAIVAHDLRNPISGIRSVTHLMQEYPYTKEQEEKYLCWITDACKTADQIIEELLMAARQRELDLLQTDYVSLNDWLKHVRDNWLQKSNFNREIGLELPPQELKARIHTGKMQRVVDNLLHNAAKFTPAEGNITLGMQQHRGGVRISITDTGIGIPEALLPTLFDQFTASSRQGLNNEPSNGLGLHICKQLVQEHGGNIYVSTKENQGTIFNIDLPFTLL